MYTPIVQVYITTTIISSLSVSLLSVTPLQLRFYGRRGNEVSIDQRVPTGHPRTSSSSVPGPVHSFFLICSGDTDRQLFVLFPLNRDNLLLAESVINYDAITTLTFGTPLPTHSDFMVAGGNEVFIRRPTSLNRPST